ncbi:hypothetical protein NW755_014091 [Fusarium falciforme]|uniref:Glycoside hydrolase family 3 N-terminal domain-containing protein n=1 Tax=Fusarium falciforme TaxID=195108 RepID=A0A9W8QS21_9HYPO|nr:hypothetical protein NW755_014091 [Fusarium falciforme]
MSYVPDDASDVGVSAVYDDPEWAIGQMLFMGWDGSEVTPQVRKLIQEHHVGSIILTAKNLKCQLFFQARSLVSLNKMPAAQHATKIVKELQAIAYNARHSQPLLTAIDQESGGVNSLFDQEAGCEFPSAMGMAATGSVDLVYETNKATAEAVRACGINIILSPMLDVLLNTGYQPLGVRSFGDGPKEVSSYGIAAVNGIKDAGIATYVGGIERMRLSTISECDPTIVVVIANASRNLYQASFAKHVDLMCSMLRMQGKKKSVIIIAVSSHYDFVLDKSIGTYVCTFDFTENAMQALVRVLWGECVAQGSLPGTLRKTKKASKSRRNWIVEGYDRHRDGPYLKGLLHALSQTSSASLKPLHLVTT